MTVQTNPMYSMNIQSGAQLLKEINKAIQTAQDSQVKKPKHPYAVPTKQSNEMTGFQTSADNGGGEMMSCLLGTMFLDMLFGMPVFQGLGDASRGLAQIGLMSAQEDEHEKPVLRSVPKQPQRVASFDEILMAAQQTEHLKAVASQTNKMRQMAMMRQMLAMLLTQMLTQQDQTEGKSGSGEGGLVPDVLRDPKLARFKQNRQSISCIRTLFARQASMTAPKFQAPKFNFAA